MSSKYRIFSLLELFIGASIVIGHNVFHVLPNEVPILLILGLLSFRVRDHIWGAPGLRRPSSWIRTFGIAFAAAALRIVGGEFVIDPFTSRFWPEAIAPSGIEEIGLSWLAALKWLGIVWTFAAVGEEFGYRGYLLTRAADAGGGSRLAYVVAVVITSILFGYGHFYKGPSGIIDSGFAGLILGAAYFINGRNLWTSILAHGFIDSFGVIVLAFSKPS